jgi:hypothetical protein
MAFEDLDAESLKKENEELISTYQSLRKEVELES